ncbi:MAG TPA: diacylglycerol kinase family protein [Trebonia sp.]
MRALLIINPRATSMSGRDAGLVVRELGSRLELHTAQTRYRGHARKLAADSAADGYDLVVTFGGDGTVNEVVNGLMNVRVPDYSGPAGPASALPAIAPVPGGGANVFARTLGLPPAPEEAVRRILSAAAAGTKRTIGLGLAESPAEKRYFTFSAGLGVDAEVVADIERRRASGRRSSTLLYMWTALRRYYTTTDRRHPALTLDATGRQPVTGLFMGVVTNSSPWTYVGSHPVRPAPHSDFMHGLDLFALRRLRTLTTLTALSQMMHANDNAPSGRDVVTATALTDVTFRADRPIAFHIDGEYLGVTELVTFRYIPHALNVIV